MREVIFCLFAFISFTARGQETTEKALYVFDSIPVFETILEDEADLPEQTIQFIQVETNKDKFGVYKNYDFNKIIYVFTKEYTLRPDEIKRIPSIKKMYQKEGKWCLSGSTIPYTGKFIDYYFSGVKKKEGFLRDGLDEGLCTSYSKNGKPACYRNYVTGTANGEYGEYFPNGKLKHAGIFKNGKEEGLWKEWYSTGNLKRERVFATGVELPANESNTGYAFLTKGIEYFNKGDYKQALAYYSKAIKLNPGNSDFYFYRSNAYLHDRQFEKAISDCDKTIELEPYYEDAYSTRALTRIQKYVTICKQTQDKKHPETQQKTEIPENEKDKISRDLRKVFELGDTKHVISDALKEYSE
jgi:antitoxin component YwqK of YwqJK toxin-antitoxin module